MDCIACVWHEHRQQTAVSIKLEPRTDNSLQLLLLIYADTLSSVDHLLPLRLLGDTAPNGKKKKKNARSLRTEYVLIYFAYTTRTHNTEFPCAAHLHVARSSVYTVLEGWPAVTRSPYSDLLSISQQDGGKTEKEVRHMPHIQA